VGTACQGLPQRKQTQGDGRGSPGSRAHSSEFPSQYYLKDTQGTSSLMSQPPAQPL